MVGLRHQSIHPKEKKGKSGGGDIHFFLSPFLHLFEDIYVRSTIPLQNFPHALVKGRIIIITQT